MSGLTHLDADGAARMVDVSAKAVTAREAVAAGRIDMSAQAAQAIADGLVKKGDVLAVARVAGIMAAKKTADIMPLCHPIPLDNCKIAIEPTEENRVLIECEVSATHKTGVEMEALTAASVAALTIYDMCKAMSHAIFIESIHLVEKTGGKSDFKK